MSAQLICGDALHLPLADKSVHMVVTSPPYWGLRDYGISGQLGLEQSPEAYVDNMVKVFREVWRVLRPDGVLFLNLGDSYANSGSSGPHTGLAAAAEASDGNHRDKSGPRAQNNYPTRFLAGLKPKDLVGIPWRVAFALQADGWYLRSDIIWHKPNPMPESVTDRPTKSHEYLFLLSKRERYYFDQEAVREPGTRYEWNTQKFKCGDITRHHGSTNGKEAANPTAGRNLRSVWTIATQPYPGSHFATFPEKLAEPCVKAGSSEHGVCAECGAPWKRVTKSRSISNRPNSCSIRGHCPSSSAYLGQPQRGAMSVSVETIGWQPTCACNAAIRPATVLDPFAGSGTTLRVAQRLGRNAIGIDLKHAYLSELATKRIGVDIPHLPFGRDELIAIEATA